MTEHEPLYNTVAPLRNVSALITLIQQVEGRKYGLPGLATFYGPSGFGKSTAAVFAMNSRNALHVQVKSCWTAKMLCQTILREMSIEPRRNIAEMVDQIARELNFTTRPLLIDEADFLVKKGMIEIVRDIYESANTPVILIGEEEFPQKLQRWERVHGRMLAWVGAKPACIDDVKHLAPIYCPDIRLDPAFLDHLLRQSHHSIRRVCVNLANVAEFAQTRGFGEIDLAAWGTRAFFATSAPAARKELA